jgi:pyrroloquinoline quinone (PQQ) biosynthesis protein C
VRRAVQDVRAPLTPSVRFRSKLELVIGPYSEACTRLVDDARLPELWPEYLVVQHQIIRATVPLTRVALDRARELNEPDLADYLERHVDEELGHDDTLLDDLELLGRPREAVLERMPSPAVASLVGAQYYWILHHHPVAFLGYVGVMEGYPPTDELVALLVERTGFPREAFRTFSEHGELDPGHRDHLDRTLDSLPLTERQEKVIGASAIATVALATAALEEVLALP